MIVCLKKLRLVVTQRVSHRPYTCQFRLWPQRATKVNESQDSDPHRDKTLARFSHPRTWGTYPREDPFWGYERQFLLSGVLPINQNLNYKLQKRLPNVLPIYQSHRKCQEVVLQYLSKVGTGGGLMVMYGVHPVPLFQSVNFVPLGRRWHSRGRCMALSRKAW